MAKIKVHILNFHNIYSHIELVLENTENQTYYGINRWETPVLRWSSYGPKQYINDASAQFSFEIEADPNKIVNEWNSYWFKTSDEASILGNNCAVAAMWFLEKFAGIPQPNLSNLSWNHLGFGIVWPSIIPCPVTLPGRIMSNAKFHIAAKKDPEMANRYSHFVLIAGIALAGLAVAESFYALMVVNGILLNLVSVTACLLSSHGFFTAYNLLSARNIADASNKVLPLRELSACIPKL